jgi:hypothetical protein
MGGRVEAPASKATLVVQFLLDRTGALQTPGNLMNLFAPLYKEFGARIHTNSWGSTHNPARPFAQLAYDVPAHNIDQFVWKIRDMVIYFLQATMGAMLTGMASIMGRKSGLRLPQRTASL